MIAAVMLVTGCGTKATGLGWIRSIDGVNKATFGFSYDATNPDAARFNGSYHDPAGTFLVITSSGTIQVQGIRLKGAGKFQRVPPPPELPGNFGLCLNDPAVPYESQDTNIPPGARTGTLDLLVCDGSGNGQGELGLGDFIQIRTNPDGPYKDYQNAQLLDGVNGNGNITVQ
jgi:hypothetical protein